ncbi:sensor histidine kinase [Pararhodonellum marinum]|uniref:sensor histidine kinase n=1 Tax=Pararhodonellum marinum TaxID=2755358 RepID=UPI00188E0ABC|nr:ATP-binding protein [Pararhodonellum marinum]
MISRNHLLSLLLSFVWITSGAQELPFVYYTPNNELNALPSAMVTNVYQDKEGFIWLSAFSSGLIRFDGSNMEIYGQQDGLVDLGTWQLLEDGAGHLWVSSNSGLVVSEEPIQNYQQGKRIKFTSTYQGIPLVGDALTMNQFTVDSKGRVWVGPDGKGLLIYEIDESDSLSVQSKSSDLYGSGVLQIKSLIPYQEGAVIAGLEGGRIVKFSDHEPIELYSGDKNSGEENFLALFEDQDKQIWAYKQNGEVVLFKNFKESPIFLAQIQPSNIASITSFQDNSIWVSNGASGIIKFNQSTGEKTGAYQRSNGLLSVNVFQVLKDREGNMWVAQSGGISKLRFNYNAFENFSARSISGEKPVLPSERVNSVLITERGLSPCRFWVGTEGGATCVDNSGDSQYITQKEGLLGDWVNGLAMDPRGRIWIATTQGLNAIAFNSKDILETAQNIRNITLFGTQAYLFSIPNSPPFLAAEHLSIKTHATQNKVESVWFPGLKSLYGVVQSKIYHFGPEHGLPSSIYKSVAYDEAGHLWVGTLDKGLYKSIQPISLEYLENITKSPSDITLFKPFWNIDNGAPTNHIEKLLWQEDKLWVGTQEGLFAINNLSAEIIHRINSSNGLPSDNAISFAESILTRNFWVGTNNGLAEVDPREAKVLKTISRQDGLIDNEVWLYGSVQVGLDGEVYFGTANGLSIYIPSLDRPNEVPPTIQLTLVDIVYQSRGRNEVTFEYSALSFANIAGVRYQTRLKGYEENWTSPSTVKRLRYTNLPAFFFPKKYSLEIMAINESGVSSETPLQFDFFIKPVPWLRWYAMLFYVVLIGSIVFAIDKYQRYRLTKKERDAARIREAELHAEAANARSMAAEAEAKALKADVEKKALEIEKIKELEKAYHELKSTQNRLIQSEKMASLGRLATGIAHEIKNPLNFINNFSEVSVELVEELDQALKLGDLGEVEYVMGQLKENTLRIEKHGKRADSIVHSMMQHARGTQSTAELFDINDLVKKYTDLAYNGKKAQNQEFSGNIEYGFDPNIPRIKIVGQEIGQVLMNLIGNSMDATRTKKQLLNESYEPKIKVITGVKDGMVYISVSDNGPGIPEAIREKIFEPFFTTKPTGEGTGLGLSLCYDIITQGHEGKLRLIQKEGEGAEFVIYLPSN